MSGYRDEVKPASDVGKVIVLLLGLTILAVLLGARLFGSTGVGEIAEGMITTVVPTQIVQTPTQIEQVVIEPTETPENLLAPKLENAIISPSENGEQLNLTGSADISCGQIIGFLDGLEVGQTTVTASGTWALSVPAPAVGEYDAVMRCVTSEGEFTAAPTRIEVPEPNSPPPATSAASIEQTPAITATVAVETPAPSAEIDQPEFTFANKMDEWIGGPLLVRGSAETGSDVELVFDNGQEPVVVTTTANAEGRFAARVVLTEVGDYEVTVQYAGTQGQPSESVVVPPDVNFGAPGNCVNTVPPFGTIEGDFYVVNDCEYFSLIANRLGVSYRDLIAVNRNILNPNNLRTGDRIQIPPLP